MHKLVLFIYKFRIKYILIYNNICRHVTVSQNFKLKNISNRISVWFSVLLHYYKQVTTLNLNRILKLAALKID